MFRVCGSYYGKAFEVYVSEFDCVEKIKNTEGVVLQEIDLLGINFSINT